MREDIEKFERTDDDSPDSVRAFRAATEAVIGVSLIRPEVEVEDRDDAVHDWLKESLGGDVHKIAQAWCFVERMLGGREDSPVKSVLRELAGRMNDHREQ